MSDDSLHFDSLRAYYERQIVNAERSLAVLDRFGEDDFENDTVLFFKRTFDGGDRVYTYAVVKVDGWWWITGRTTGSMSWSRLVEHHLTNAHEVWVATEWEDL